MFARNRIPDFCYLFLLGSYIGTLLLMKVAGLPNIGFHVMYCMMWVPVPIYFSLRAYIHEAITKEEFMTSSYINAGFIGLSLLGFLFK